MIMGGLLFNTSRKTAEEFIKYKSHIEFLMNFYHIDYKMPLYYRNKKDFGDLDVLIKKIVPTKRLIEIFNKCEYHYDNIDAVVSFNYKDFQIDFIKIDPEDFEIAYYYYSYNDLGNLIGQLAKTNHLKFGFDGLKYEYISKGQYRGTIYVSKNIDKILKFLDLDPAEYRKGFDSMESMFNFIAKSKYFNPYVSDLNPYGYSKSGVALYRLNKVNRTRNEKRKTYQEWLKYVDQFKLGIEYYLFKEDVPIEDVYDRIDEFFPKSEFKRKLEFYDEKERERIEIKRKFNGHVILELIPDLKKEDRQLFIDFFKSEISKKYSSFEKFVIDSTEEEIKNQILNIHSIFKKKYG